MDVKNNGFTLIETLIAVVIIATGVLISFLFFLRASAVNEMARDITIATTHSDYVLEEMYGLSSLNSITETNWQTWAANEGLDDLPEESISVAYQDIDANPLEIAVTVNWSRKTRPYNMTFITELTK